MKKKNEKKNALKTVSSSQGAALFQRWDADMVLVREVSPAPVMASSLYFDWLSLRQVITTRLAWSPAISTPLGGELTGFVFLRILFISTA